MSKIEVNTVDAQCGSTITVGSSGKNVKIEGNDIRSNDYKAADGGVIASQSGTTITLGASGDTVTLACGASQSGFGRTGTVDWQTGSIKTSTFTAVSGEGYFVNTTGGAVTVNLPAGVAGAIVGLKDYANTWDSNAVTLNPNGSDNIGGGNTVDPTLAAEGGSVLLVFVDSTQGWLPTQQSVTASPTGSSAFITATGGTITTSGDYKIHTFTGSGCFALTAGTSAPNNKVSYVVVAAGGGSPYQQGGGGGAGGFREGKCSSDPYADSPLDAGTAITVTSQTYPITVGAGGAGGTSGNSNTSAPGTVSTFSTITSTGGGNGAPSGPYPGGAPGGSGGGAGENQASPGSTGNQPPVSPPQGNPGGSGNTGTGNAGGGGGAGAVGGNSVGPTGGAGGNGIATSITGSPVTRAGGGGGGGYPSTNGPGGAGGSGGGGTAGNGLSTGGGTSGGAGTANTGGGGGGGSWPTTTGGSGGSGVVILRYKFQ